MAVTDSRHDPLADGVLEQFALPGPVTSVEPFTGGHINDSWLVTAGPARFLLQRLNGSVFPRPDHVMENFARVTAHLGEALEREQVRDAERRALTLVSTHTGKPAHIDAAGAYWRALRFIEGAIARDRATTDAEAYEAGRAFGRFQRLLANYDGPRLHETIPDFHHTPRRVEALERAIAVDRRQRRTGARPEIETVLRNRPLATALLDRQARGDLVERVVHNDAKMPNVLLDATTGEGLCVVDLDTVMPGLALYDFGDMARTMASDVAEDATELDAVTVHADRFAALARGYLEGSGLPGEEGEPALLVTAARVITYEQAVRFLTDYLEGDRYYRTAYSQHNLQRCRAQLALLDAFTTTESALTRAVARS
jgi:Ser/Thr protein kinase RdoA (MazF antagonist)